ncbi:uncharacterized protein LOC126611531 isoform X3 [Malus sylvestris]|uniref:uncharacterized protein LOC126611531 isoform X3 n=1 Tax=Malus sylvestris TaxID=3752 RepID=UPI0021ABCDD0|nr:uncharacterized protein LOC126611531 isoform X3 [Malus sylvestris]
MALLVLGGGGCVRLRVGHSSRPAHVRPSFVTFATVSPRTPTKGDRVDWVEATSGFFENDTRPIMLFDAQCIYEISHFDEWDRQFPPPFMLLTASLQIRLNQIPSKFQPPLPPGPQLSFHCSSKLSYWYISSTLILFQTQRLIMFTLFSLLFSKLSQPSQNDL